MRVGREGFVPAEEWKDFGGKVRAGRKKALTTPARLGKPILPQGQLAQLVEHRLHTAGATGSSPVLPTRFTDAGFERVQNYVQNLI